MDTRKLALPTGHNRPILINLRAVVCCIMPWVALTAVGAQISPGELSAPHAHLDDSGSCLKCHDRQQGVSAERCLACHRPLAERIDAGRGLHARNGYRDCRSCHMEHAGREFELIDWGDQGRDSFRHRLTGYELEGGHASLGCRKCHRPEHIRSNQDLTDHGKDLQRTYLGLEPGCLGCHDDTHRGRYGEDVCLDCHSMRAWVPVGGFDHSTTAYPLTGRHIDVTCLGCHRPEVGATEPRYYGIAFERCADCHSDEHRGQLDATCESCHTTNGWTPERYDHALSSYPLTGRHQEVACHDCHRAAVDPATGANYRVLRGLAHQTCLDCHRDTHEQRLGSDCSRCHSTAGWRSTPRATFDHGQTRYPLTGRHRTVECESCHPVSEPLTMIEFERCANCHEDTHVGQFADREEGGACEDCHRVEGFLPALFGLSEHQDSRFKLEGAHAAIPCNVCHRLVAATALPQPVPMRADPVVQFRFDTLECEGCHANPHGNAVNRFLGQDRCKSCHSLEGWRLIEFDHELTATTLAGAHVGAPCRGCHVRETDDVASIRWVGLGERCADCHTDPHLGQFVESGNGTDCRRCHTADTVWSVLVFDHDRDARYPLEGAHLRVACGSCHVEEFVSDRRMVRYRPLPTDCRGCHRGEVPP